MQNLDKTIALRPKMVEIVCGLISGIMSLTIAIALHKACPLLSFYLTFSYTMGIILLVRASEQLKFRRRINLLIESLEEDTSNTHSPCK